MEVDIPKQPEHNTVNPVLEPQKPPVLKKFPGTKESTKSNMMIVVVAFLVVGLGVATGWFLSGTKAGTSSNSSEKTSQSGETAKKSDANEEGQIDEAVKYQDAEGKLVEGGIKGEGTHHIERDNNPSRFVYLTSTAIDLDKYIDKKVQIWGETISSVNAPWLMDVVKIKITE